MSQLLPQYIISAACEEDLAKHGDNFRGAGYTKSPQEAAERYALMLDVVREPDRPLTILDLGCGMGHLLEFMEASSRYDGLRYVGLDISPRYLAVAQAKHPEAEFVLMDVLARGAHLPTYDYVILNGVFNYRGSIAYDDMMRYWEQMMVTAYAHCRLGVAFNVMSTLVDWERDDLFHMPFDTMTRFVCKHLSRHFVIRHDYRAYEYTTYVYREAFAAGPASIRDARPRSST